MRRALQRQVVGLGRARGEHDLARVGADQPRDIGARLLDRRLAPPCRRRGSRWMRVAELLGEVRQHRVEHARVERRRRLVVEIDRPAVRCRAPMVRGARLVDVTAFMLMPRSCRRATRPARRASRATARSMRRNCSILVVVPSPRLTRIALPAMPAGTPIAASTWDGPTLPDEQAAPALTATPARSSAMIWVSAGHTRHRDAGRVRQARHAAPNDDRRPAPPASAAASSRRAARATRRIRPGRRAAARRQRRSRRCRRRSRCRRGGRAPGRRRGAAGTIGDAVAHDQRADTLRSAELVRRQR